MGQSMALVQRSRLSMWRRSIPRLVNWPWRVIFENIHSPRPACWARKDGKFGIQAVFDNTSQCTHDQPRQCLLSTPTGERSRSGTDESYRSASSRISFRERPHTSDLLNQQDFKAGRNHVLTLMQKMGTEVLYCKPRLTRTNPANRIYPYLLIGLLIAWSNQVWAMEIIYISMARGFFYLTVSLDWYSRCALPYQLSITMATSFAFLHSKRPSINTENLRLWTSIKTVSSLTWLFLNSSQAMKFESPWMANGINELRQSYTILPRIKLENPDTRH